MNVRPARPARADGDVRRRLVDAAMRLLESDGPSGVKARAVAAEAGLTTAAVYNHFGGMPELLGAVSDGGFSLLAAEFATLVPTDDPAADIYFLALRCRDFAHASPHRYDLMLGLSARGTYRASEQANHVSGHSPSFHEAYRHLLAVCSRLVASERIARADPDAIASRLWVMVHGFLGLELARHFDSFGDPVTDVLEPMATDLFVGMGDLKDKVAASLRAGARAASPLRSSRPVR